MTDNVFNLVLVKGPPNQVEEKEGRGGEIKFILIIEQTVNHRGISRNATFVELDCYVLDIVFFVKMWFVIMLFVN